MDEWEQQVVAALTAAGHSLKIDRNGVVDFLAMDSDDPDGFGGHNGPVCLVCGESWCEHCLGETGLGAIESCKGTVVVVGSRGPAPIMHYVPQEKYDWLRSQNLIAEDGSWVNGEGRHITTPKAPAPADTALE